MLRPLFLHRALDCLKRVEGRTKQEVMVVALKQYRAAAGKKTHAARLLPWVWLCCPWSLSTRALSGR